MDPWAWVQAIFGGQGNSPTGGATVEGSPAVDNGFSPILSWAIGQSFSGAGPLGQYLALLFGSPGSDIPSVAGAKQQEDRAARSNRGVPGLASDVDGDLAYGACVRVRGTRPVRNEVHVLPASPSRGRAPNGGRVLERLDRGEEAESNTSPTPQIQEVRVFGTPRVNSSSGDEFGPPTYPVWGDNRIIINPDPPLRRRREGAAAPKQRKQSPARVDEVATVTVHGQPREPSIRDWIPDFDPNRVDVYRPQMYVPGQRPHRRRLDRQSSNPFDQSMDLFNLTIERPSSPDRPEQGAEPRAERDTGADAEPIPVNRSFWSRGGTGLTAGGVTAAASLVALFWWNPVGWVAGASLALAVAGGVAVTAASAVQLGSSYAGATTPEVDVQMNRATSAALGVSSLGGLGGAVIGTVGSGDAEGFETGAFYGGLTEIAITLPGALRGIPGLWNSAVPWIKSLLLSPMWFMVGASSGGTNVRGMARILSRSGRLSSRVSAVEYLGTTPLIERDADWARYQIFSTRSRNEAVFRLTYATGEQRIVLADRFAVRSGLITEAKYGDMGQMWKPEREAHIISQAQTYLDISNALELGGGIRYVISSERGATRLTQRFSSEFPEAVSSGQLWVDWVPWE